ncbi:MAG: bifunctional folylpolyglutamate synthase/dihydrofolate synthase [Bacteroidales bacterium]|nr:bifunctional folylpolyglutamate synthase/dihydrofolate synthase [Bacteroidales bacterium]
MNYRETLNYLYTQLPMFHRVGAPAYKANLDNTVSISKLLDHPELKFPSIHIAGTNGKGSTSHMIASILQEAGYKTGLFTSPHLKDFRERIKVNGRMILKSDVTSFVTKFKNEFSELEPSFFEWTFGLATHHFHQQQVDIAVMETGMGGRLDSTNILHPRLTIITNIGFDHMQFLGNTLVKIAMEKAGIIKPGVPLVIGETQAEVFEVFLEKARELNSPVTFADQCFSIHANEELIPGKSSIKMEVLRHEDQLVVSVESPLTGTYQLKNILTVLESIEKLKELGYQIPEEAVTKGIKNVVKNTGFHGRWQILAKKPLTIADISHNKDGLKVMLSQLKNAADRKLHFVLGVVNDKDIDGMLHLLPQNATYYFCKADIPRGLDAEELAKKAILSGLKGEVFTSVKNALKAARQAAGKEDLVLVSGSAFVVAEVL